ncbi:polymorphic toxin-type HINT domain-containing protein [Dactylosporangium sp. NPDC000555]|uniref:polymorphic toxin-type HINT domain-containing protein n=1 Tax=Dactylosporangium sp. NPDC000555 TaxID=3154260 RepID=UPI0033168248
MAPVDVRRREPDGGGDHPAELRQFATRIPGNANPSTYDKTTYSYNRRGLLSKVVDPAGYEWIYDYDLRGRNTSTKDPDSGTTTKEYDNAGRLKKTTDSRGKVLVYTYDELNRKTGLYQTSIGAANLLASWSYDTTKLNDNVTVAKGYPTASIRYVSGQQYKSTVVQYNDRDTQAVLDGQKRAKEAQQKAWCKAHPIKCRLKTATTATLNWVDKHKAEIIGTVAGLAVGLGCGAAIGWTGVGAVACGALAGAVQNMVTYALKTKWEGKGNFSWGGMLKTGVKGAIVGGLMGGLGAAGGAALKAGKAALMSGGGLKAAAQAGGKAAAAESRAIAQQTKNLFKKSCSFTADTKVQMADGKRKPIKDVKVGDTVQATDPRTGMTSPRTVLAVKVNRDNALTDLRVKAPNGTVATVRTSQNHPFWDSDQQVWVSAGDLRPGAEQYGSAGTSSEIVDVRNYLGARDMYDLTVADIHTYYVLAGNTPVLVHNCGEFIAGPNLGSLRVSAANPSASEVAAAQHMAARGSNVVLRDPVGSRGTATSDLLVDGVQWDVYTPTTGNVSRIVSAVASKGSQVQGGGVIIDLSRTSVTADQLANIQARIAGTGARVGQIEVMP